MEFNLTRFEKSTAEEKPPKKDLLSLSRKRKIGIEDDNSTKRPALKPSNGAVHGSKCNVTDQIASKLQEVCSNNVLYHVFNSYDSVY